MNRYTTRSGGFLCRWTAALLALLAAATLFSAAVSAEGQQPAGSDNAASSSDVSSGSDLPGRIPADFKRVASVPVNVTVPDFYQQVVNVSGMYIFTMPDGTIYKRIYGAVGNTYGWYEPVGPDNTVYIDSPLIDIFEDSRMYYEAVGNAELEAMERQEYAGILPPDAPVTEVEELQGVSVMDLTFYCVGGAVLLCLIITLTASSARSREQRNKSYR